MEPHEKLGDLSEVVAEGYYPKNSKMLTDPYASCMKWAFGEDWKRLGEGTARMQWEFRHADLCKTLPPSWSDAVKIVTKLWAEAVRTGTDLDQELKDAITKAAESMR